MTSNQAGYPSRMMPANPGPISPRKIAALRIRSVRGAERSRRQDDGIVPRAFQQLQQAIAAHEVQRADHHEVVAVIVEQCFDLRQPFAIPRTQQFVVQFRRSCTFRRGSLSRDRACRRHARRSRAAARSFCICGTSLAASSRNLVCSSQTASVEHPELIADGLEAVDGFAIGARALRPAACRCQAADRIRS